MAYSWYIYQVYLSINISSTVVCLHQYCVGFVSGRIIYVYESIRLWFINSEGNGDLVQTTPQFYMVLVSNIMLKYYLFNVIIFGLKESIFN